MEATALKRYRVRNLDCAACAAKIENGLKRSEGIEDAILDFAGLTLQVRARDSVPVGEIVHRIDPKVDLIDDEKPETEPAPPDGYRFYRELLLLVLSTLLFLSHLWMTKHIEWTALSYFFSISAYFLAGWNVILAAARTIRTGGLFDENVLMTIATIGAFAIDAPSEATAVMLFYKVGEMLQELAVARSRRAIGSLLAARPRLATVQTLGGYKTVSPGQVSPGDVILVKPGEKIPLDGVVLSGESQVNNAALTGESLPSSARPGTPAMAGAINLDAALRIEVTRPFKDSSIVKILEMVQHAAARKANTEKFITAFARYYTPAVVIGAALVAVLPPLLIPDAAFKTWIHRALVLLVISCPCALMISIPLGYFGGIGRASRRGILVKGSNFIDALADVKTVVFDKTGTLTQGVFEVEDIISANGHSPEEILTLAALAESHSTHPIATSILRAYESRGGRIDPAAVTEHQALAGLGVRAVYEGREIVVGSDVLLHEKSIAHDLCEIDGTVAHVTIDGRHTGYIRIGDRLKPGAVEAVSSIRKSGVEKVIMLTGDNRCPAEKVARLLGLDEFHAGLLPEDKVQHLEQIMEDPGRKGKVAFVGDGINDAPVLARSDVGVAMGALGSDAAIETADVVLMTDSPGKMAEAIQIAGDTRRIVWQNIVLALCVKLVFVSFGAFGLAGMWEAVFADMGTAIVAVLNATRALGKRSATN